VEGGGGIWEKGGGGTMIAKVPPGRRRRKASAVMARIPWVGTSWRSRQAETRSALPPSPRVSSATACLKSICSWLPSCECAMTSLISSGTSDRGPILALLEGHLVFTPLACSLPGKIEIWFPFCKRMVEEVE